jgi:hypothetical protein
MQLVYTIMLSFNYLINEKSKTWNYLINVKSKT